MYLTQEVKKDIFKEFGGNEVNTGSAESQIA
ncbi:MAG: 30S ribosomal protein S15, partial [Bacteroidales bacterium]|nr:30S ribosomal protein S15 [Bacteroidales bacterium]